MKSVLGGGCEVDGNYPEVYFSWEIDGDSFSWDYILFPPNLSSRSSANNWLDNRGFHQAQMSLDMLTQKIIQRPFW